MGRLRLHVCAILFLHRSRFTIHHSRSFRSQLRAEANWARRLRICSRFMNGKSEEVPFYSPALAISEVLLDGNIFRARRKWTLGWVGYLLSGPLHAFR